MSKKNENRYVIEFSDRFNDFIEKKADDLKMSKTDVIRIALALYHLVAEEVGLKSDRNLAVVTDDGKILKQISLVL